MADDFVGHRPMKGFDHEMSLAEGVHFERRLFHAAFALADQKEGMDAFVAKRKPDFKHR